MVVTVDESQILVHIDDLLVILIDLLLFIITGVIDLELLQLLSQLLIIFLKSINLGFTS